MGESLMTLWAKAIDQKVPEPRPWYVVDCYAYHPHGQNGNQQIPVVLYCWRCWSKGQRFVW